MIVTVLGILVMILGMVILLGAMIKAVRGRTPNTKLGKVLHFLMCVQGLLLVFLGVVLIYNGHFSLLSLLLVLAILLLGHHMGYIRRRG